MVEFNSKKKIKTRYKVIVILNTTILLLKKKKLCYLRMQNCDSQIKSFHLSWDIVHYQSILGGQICKLLCKTGWSNSNWQLPYLKWKIKMWKPGKCVYWEQKNYLILFSYMFQANEFLLTFYLKAIFNQQTVNRNNSTWTFNF